MHTITWIKKKGFGSQSEVWEEKKGVCFIAADGGDD